MELTDEWGETAVQAGSFVPFFPTSAQLRSILETKLTLAGPAGDIVNLISPDLPTLLKPLVQTPYSPSPLTPPPPPPQPPVLRLSSSPKNAATLLVLEPDTLVPSTSLAASLSCARRAVLRTLVRSSTGDVGKALLYGNVLHTTFQTLLERAVQSGGSFKEGDISRAVSQALGDDDAGGGGGEGDKVKGDVWRAGLDWVDVKREVQEKAQGGFGAFGERFVEESSKDGANGVRFHSLSSSPCRSSCIKLIPLPFVSAEAGSTRQPPSLLFNPLRTPHRRRPARDRRRPPFAPLRSAGQSRRFASGQARQSLDRRRGGGQRGEGVGRSV